MDNMRLREAYQKANSMDMDTLKNAIDFQTKILGVYRDVFNLRKKYGEAPTPKPKKEIKMDAVTMQNQVVNRPV